MNADVLLTTAIALGGALAGFLVAWGAMRATTAQLRKEVDELRSDVKRLNAVVVRLTTQLAVLADREERDASGSRPRLALDESDGSDNGR